MSAPPPVTVNVPLLKVASPAGPTEPMSRSLHPDGSGPPPGGLPGPGVVKLHTGPEIIRFAIVFETTFQKYLVAGARFDAANFCVVVVLVLGPRFRFDPTFVNAVAEVPK